MFWRTSLVPALGSLVNRLGGRQVKEVAGRVPTPQGDLGGEASALLLTAPGTCAPGRPVQTAPRPLEASRLSLSSLDEEQLWQLWQVHQILSFHPRTVFLNHTHFIA